jgi:hypothetical protein
MTLQSHRRVDRLIDDRLASPETIRWEPQVAHPHFRRRPSERATIVEVSANGALVRARASADIMTGVRVAIGRGNERGLVAIRSVEAVSEGGGSDVVGDANEAEYGVQFLWLDPALQAFFDDAVTSDLPFELGWR